MSEQVICGYIDDSDLENGIYGATIADITFRRDRPGEKSVSFHFAVNVPGTQNCVVAHASYFLDLDPDSALSEFLLRLVSDGVLYNNEGDVFPFHALINATCFVQFRWVYSDALDCYHPFIVDAWVTDWNPDLKPSTKVREFLHSWDCCVPESPAFVEESKFQPTQTLLSSVIDAEANPDLSNEALVKQ